MMLATCIGCGCNDYQACYDEDNDAGCHWVRLDRRAGLGVCSCCPAALVGWDKGDREIRITTATESVS